MLSLDGRSSCLLLVNDPAILRMFGVVKSLNGRVLVKIMDYASGIDADDQHRFSEVRVFVLP